MVAPCAMAVSASANRRSRDVRRASPSPWAGKVASRVTARTAGRREARIRRMSSVVRKGCGRRRTAQLSGPGSRMLPAWPAWPMSDMDSCSRYGSMGGLVTWAKRCLNQRNRDCGSSLRQGRGLSVPMEQTGSWAFSAMGTRTCRCQALSQPAWRRRRSSGGRACAASPSSPMLFRVSRRTACFWSQRRQGWERMTWPLISASGAMRWCSTSARIMRRGWSWPRWMMSSSGVSTRPLSEPSTIRPSRETLQRQGRRPLRSSMAPTRRQPSVKTRQVGPSQGSMREEWYS